MPVTEKTYLFKELFIETIIRNPKKVGLSGYKWDLGFRFRVWALGPRALKHLRSPLRKLDGTLQEDLPETLCKLSLGYMVL